jgi:hypothetical protein
MLIYLAMAIDLPSWAIKEIDKIRQAFLWKSRREVKGGHCLVAWRKVCRPLELGGLGISSLKELCWALRMRWLWLAKTEPSRPWSSLQIQVPEKVHDFFAVAVQSDVGDGANTLFWTDQWLHGQRILDLAPRLHALVKTRRAKKRTVLEVFINQAWMRDIQGALTVGAIVEFLQLWDILTQVQLQPDTRDRHSFRLASNGNYSAKSAYESLFVGSVLFDPFERIWKSGAPPKCRFFMWFVAHNRCWTADRLQKRGLDHPEHCLLCDQEAETIDHRMVGCVFARQFWLLWLRQVRLQFLAPLIEDWNFMEWWSRINGLVEGAIRQDLNSLVILGAWSIWNHRNQCVFDKISPCVATVIRRAGEERELWEMAGARSIALLSAPLSVL